jgi:LysM repeat protein
VPSASGSSVGVTYPPSSSESVMPIAQPTYLPEGTPGRVAPTRPGSPNAAALSPSKSAANVAPVTPYTIQKGDSLWTIAKKHHITVAELTKANNLGSTASLQPGKKLMIPGKPVSATAPADNSLALSIPTVSAPPEAPARTSGELTTHVVASGESLGIIARKYQVTIGELARANNITDPAKIRVGQPLKIPVGKHSGARTAGSSAPKSTPSAPAVKPAAATPAPQPEPPAAETAPQFEIKPPPPGQDLDAGLKENTSTDVPTIKVEDAKPEETPKR